MWGEGCECYNNFACEMTIRTETIERRMIMIGVVVVTVLVIVGVVLMLIS